MGVCCFAGVVTRKWPKWGEILDDEGWRENGETRRLKFYVSRVSVNRSTMAVKDTTGCFERVVSLGQEKESPYKYTLLSNNHKDEVQEQLFLKCKSYANNHDTQHTH